MPAQPFAGAKSRRKRQDSQGPRRPQDAGEGEADSREKCKDSRQAKHTKRERPGELVGFHQEGGAKPPEAGDEIAEAQPPAVTRRFGDASPA